MKKMQDYLRDPAFFQFFYTIIQRGYLVNEF